jgi:hypothetical protein
MRKIPLILIATFFMSCGDWGWQSVESDHESTLNVFALLVAEPDSSYGFVIVNQTLRLQDIEKVYLGSDTVYYGQDSSEDFYIDDVYKSGYDVLDATVIISHGDTNWIFYDEPDSIWYSYDNESKYIDTTDTFHPIPGETYNLLVETPDGRSVSGSVTVPLRPNIREESVSDSVSNKAPYSVAFSPVSDNGIFRIKTYLKYENYSYCGSDQSGIIASEMDTIWTSRVKDCGDWWGNAEDGPVAFQITLESIEPNYYAYFIENGDEDEFISFILGDGGSTGKSFGIEGGYGLFGAISSDKIERIFVP